MDTETVCLQYLIIRYTFRRQLTSYFMSSQMFRSKKLSRAILTYKLSSFCFGIAVLTDTLRTFILSVGILGGGSWMGIIPVLLIRWNCCWWGSVVHCWCVGIRRRGCQQWHTYSIFHEAVALTTAQISIRQFRGLNSDKLLVIRAHCCLPSPCTAARLSQK